jgi:hypothetical protein
MALENEGTFNQIFNRWTINHEPLRNDAKNLLPILQQVIDFDPYHPEKSLLLSAAAIGKSAATAVIKAGFTPECNDLFNENKAKKLYYHFSNNHPTIYTKRFPTWDELTEKERQEWRDKNDPL